MFVVTRNGASLSDDDVREYVRSNLARYKVPRDVIFLSELPRNPTGKVLKRELARYDGDAGPVADGAAGVVPPADP